MEKLKLLGKIITFTGILLAVSGYVMFYNNLPVLFYSTYSGPFLFFVGLGMLSMRLIILASKEKKQDIGKIFFRSVLLFWCFCALFGVTIMTVGNITFTGSDAYQFATRHLQENKTYEEKWGKIKGFGFLVGGTLSSKSAKLDFTVRTEKENRNAHIELVKNESGEWEVVEVDGL